MGRCWMQDDRQDAAEQHAVEAVVQAATFGCNIESPPPKVLGDVVEAPVGAVLVDSGCNLDATWQVGT